jgi:hypothetical protein
MIDEPSGTGTRCARRVSDRNLDDLRLFGGRKSARFASIARAARAARACCRLLAARAACEETPAAAGQTAILDDLWLRGGRSSSRFGVSGDARGQPRCHASAWPRFVVVCGARWVQVINIRRRRRRRAWRPGRGGRPPWGLGLFRPQLSPASLSRICSIVTARATALQGRRTPRPVAAQVDVGDAGEVSVVGGDQDGGVGEAALDGFG